MRRTRDHLTRCTARGRGAFANGATRNCNSTVQGACVALQWPFGWTAHEQKPFQSRMRNGSLLDEKRDGSGLTRCLFSLRAAFETVPGPGTATGAAWRRAWPVPARNRSPAMVVLAMLPEPRHIHEHHRRSPRAGGRQGTAQLSPPWRFPTPWRRASSRWP